MKIQKKEVEKAMKKNNKPFNITSVCRADMQSIGFDTSSLSDSDMRRIARKMTDNYCECCFWSSLESILVDIYNLKQGDM